MTETTAAPTPAPRSYTVRNFIDGAKLRADSSYTLTNLSDAWQQQAGLVSHYSTLAAKASRQVDDLELLIEATEATVYRKLRDAVPADTKITEVQLAKDVARDTRVLALKRALNEAKEIEAIAKGAVKAMDHKRDMLVQEGAHTRKEMDGELRLLAGGARDEAIDAAKQRLLARITGGQAA